MWQMGGFGRCRGQVNHFIAMEKRADRVTPETLHDGDAKALWRLDRR